MRTGFPVIMYSCSLLIFVGLAISRIAMGQICDGTPCDCSQPDIVDCSGRGLSEIPPFRNFFSGRIKLLNFSDNNFTIFDPNEFGFHFIGVTTIEVLDLSNNQLTSIANSFAVPNMVPSYDKLDLSNNNFTTFPGKALPLRFTRVDLEIDISNNQLRSLPMHFVANNSMNLIPVLTLIARNNLIDYIHPMAFAADVVTELRLDLTNNRLTNISEEFYFPVSPNREFKMSGNPWNCDCNFRWILNSDFGEISLSSPPLCNSPVPLSARNLFDLTPSDFVCSPKADNVRKEMTITVGDNLFLCPVSADPDNSLIITWSFSMNCQFGNEPLKLSAKSKEVAIRDVTCFPQSDVKCFAENYAGSVEIDLSIRRAATVNLCFNDLEMDLTTRKSDDTAYPQENIESWVNMSGVDDPMPLPYPNTGSSGGNGGFVFLVILVVLSLLGCVTLGGYYVYLREQLKDAEEFSEYTETYTAFSSSNNCTISPIRPRRPAPPPPQKQWSEC